MTCQRLPVIALTLGLLLLLAALGVAYGLWSETLTIDGTVNTGYLEARWDEPSCRDKEPKDVGITTAEVDEGDDNLLHFLISNGYPSYEGDCQVEYTYLGTIPVRVEAIHFVPGEGLTNCSVSQSPNTGSFTATCDQLTITWADGLCTQLHYDDFLASSLRVHVEQLAQQSTTYGFQVQVQLNQYNESQCP